MNTDTNLNLIVTPETVTTAGAISYWRLSGPVRLDALRAAWEGQGLDPELLPAPPSPETAFGRAVRELQHKRQLVRPLARRGVWVVVDEQVRPGQVLAHRQLLRAVYNPARPSNADLTCIDATPDEFRRLEYKIADNYARFRGELDPADISAWLVHLTSKQNAVSLRDTGGIYFVPRPGVEFWRKVVTAVRSVSAHQLFTIPAMKNSEAIDAISDAVSQEAAALVEEMDKELAATGDDALGERALRTRAAQCRAQLDKVTAYEELLGVKLGAVRERIDQLSANIAHAVLIAGEEAVAA